MIFRSNNTVIANLAQEANAATVDRASYRGVALKSIYFSFLTIISAVATAVLLFQPWSQDFILWVLPIAFVMAFVFGIITAFSINIVPITGTVYCALIGLVVGAISALVEQYFPGVVLTALLSTLGVFKVMLLLYVTRVIRVGQKFRSVMISALVSIFLLSIIFAIVSFASPAARNALFGNIGFAIGMSAVMIVVASLFILVDLSRMDEVVRLGLDRKYEWKASFGLIVTLIWLYINMLRFIMLIMASSGGRR